MAHGGNHGRGWAAPFAGALVLAGSLVWVPGAEASSCAPPPPIRAQVRGAEVAFIGTVLRHGRPDAAARRGSGFGGSVLLGTTMVRFRVDEVLKGRLGDHIDVGVPEEWRPKLEPGKQVAILPFRSRDQSKERWELGPCGGSFEPAEARAAVGPLPPAAPGRIARVQPLQLGDVRVVAVGAQGQVVGYGPGTGSVVRLAACPGNERIVEAFVREGSQHQQVDLAVRNLSTMEVEREIVVDPAPSTITLSAVACLDRSAEDIAVFSGGYQHHEPGRLLRRQNGTWSLLWSGDHRFAAIPAKADAVYVTGAADGTVHKVPFAGGKPMLVARHSVALRDVRLGAGERTLIAYAGDNDRVEVDLRRGVVRPTSEPVHLDRSKADLPSLVPVGVSAEYAPAAQPLLLAGPTTTGGPAVGALDAGEGADVAEPVDEPAVRAGSPPVTAIAAVATSALAAAAAGTVFAIRRRRRSVGSS